MGESVAAVFLQTRNWGRTVSFLQRVGFTADFETDHNSGQLSRGGGPPLFVAEVPDREPATALVVPVADETLDPGIEVLTPFEDTHYGTREATVRDPDGRTWVLRVAS